MFWEPEKHLSCRRMSLVLCYELIGTETTDIYSMSGADDKAMDFNTVGPSLNTNFGILT